MREQSKSTSSSSNVEWYSAEVVLRITVQGDQRNVVHKNLLLVRANSPEDAYNKATSIGHEHTMSYPNPQGKLVRIQFAGLSRLSAIYDRLEHGAELLYEEHVGVSDQEIRGLIPPKERLSVFRRAESTRGPDYSSAEILDQASKSVTDH